MKVKQNFGKIDILKTQELVSFWGVKTDFGKIAQKWGIKKKDFNQYYVVAFDPIKIYTHSAPQNDRLNLSFVKDSHVFGKKMARYGRKRAFYQLLFFGSSSNLHGASGYIWGHNFRPNQDLDPLSTSKWPSEPQFCER